MTRTTTRADLAEAVFQKVGLNRAESARLVEEILELMAATLERGEDLKLSSFATFSVRAKNERVGRNPKTGEEATISPRRVVSFKASGVLKSKVFSGNLKLKRSKLKVS
jgi:integration host factor subunit alpha